MNFSEMNGYEFEEHITILLEKMGFESTRTSLSGDGGVDVVAINKNPIIGGTYLIQCKNWIQPVGQPVIRDLYGVIMSERANKGILITTSHFTEQAREFAKDKNIELVGRDELSSLLELYELGIETFVKERKFYEFEIFNLNRYEYLKKKAMKENEINSYVEQLAYLSSLLTVDNYDIAKAGLIDEMLEVNQIIIGKCKGKGKEKVKRKTEHEFIQAYLYFVKGELYKCIEIMKSTGMFEFTRPIIQYFPCKMNKMCEFSYPFNLVAQNNNQREGIQLDQKENTTGMEYVMFVEKSDSKYILVLNLFFAARYLECENLENYIGKGITKNKVESTNVFFETKHLEYCAKYLNRILSKIFDDILFFPIEFKSSKSEGENYIQMKECKAGDGVRMEEFIKLYWENQESIIDKMNMAYDLFGFSDQENINE